MDQSPEFGYMFMLRITPGTFTKADIEAFHLETVIVYNFPHPILGTERL